MPYAEVSTYHILWSDVVVVERAALDTIAADASASDDTQDDTQDDTAAAGGSEA
jgi:hypothetical protein